MERDTDELIKRAQERWAKPKPGRPQEPQPKPKDWVEQIEQKIIAARYGNTGVVTNAEALQLVRYVYELEGALNKLRQLMATRPQQPPA